MLRPSILASGIMAAALLILAAAPVLAEPHGGGGNHGGGGYHGGSSFRGYSGGHIDGGNHGGYHGGYNRDSGFHADYRTFGYNGYSYGYRGYNSGRYYASYPSIGLGLGFYTDPYYYGYPAPTTSIAVDPPPLFYQRSYPPDTSLDPPPVPAPPASDDGTALVEVLVPADAQVWFNGNPTTQRGEQRMYASPPLTPGRDFHYDIRARWTEDGHVIDQTRTVTVQANGRFGVDFTRPEPLGAPKPAPK